MSSPVHVVAVHTVDSREGGYYSDLFFYFKNDGDNPVIEKLGIMGRCTRSGKLFCIRSNESSKRDGSLYLSDVLEIIFGSETTPAIDRYVPIPGVDAIIVDAMLIINAPIDDSAESIIMFAE